MRKINVILVSMLLFMGVGAIYSQMRNACAEPIRYALGDFDARFGLTQKEFLKAVEEAEAVWEKPIGRELFTYDETASFKINLIYDERQKRTEEYEHIQENLESSESQFKSVEEEYAAAIAAYEEKKGEYEKESGRFEIDLADYNREVDYWNARGGAPEKKYAELQRTQAELNRRSTALEGVRQEMNALSRRINIIAERGNELAEDYNSTVSTYNQKFGTTTEFDQGDYRGTEINVYQFKAVSDMKMVIAHELGHALGLDHVDDPKAVMHYFMGEQNLNNLAATAEDVAALKGQCRIK